MERDRSEVATRAKQSAEVNPLWQSLALSPAGIQTKLTIGEPNDPYEHEADQVAERVMRMATPPGISDKLSFTARTSPKAQRKCASCEDEEKVQRKEAGPSADAPTSPPVVHDALNSPGQPLDPMTRTFMEERFDHDFGHVRVHSDTREADMAAHSISALAFTQRANVVFASGQYQPQSEHGRKLLAHELTHVVQQRAAEEVAGYLATGDEVSTQTPHVSLADRGTSGAVQRQYSHRSAPTFDPNALIPIANFITYIQAVETTYSTDTPQQILTRIRQQYYKGLGFDQLTQDAPQQEMLAEPSLIVGPGGEAYMHAQSTRRLIDPSVGTAAYSHLTARADENATGDNPSPYIVMPDGSRIDVGHLLLGLDSLLHPRVAEPFAAYGISGSDTAGWPADLALASYWTSHHALEGSPAGNAPIHPATADFNAYYNASAPNEDILGDTDAFGLNQQWTSAPGQQLSQVVRAYYLGAGGNAPGVDRRWRTFCATNGLGYTVIGGTVTWAPTIEAVWVPRISRLCDLFDAGNISKGFSVTFGTANSRDTWPYSLPALRRFLLWLKPRLEAEISAHP